MKNAAYISLLLGTLALTFHFGFTEAKFIDRFNDQNYYNLGKWVGERELYVAYSQAVDSREGQAQKTQEELEKVKKERDKAVADLEKLQERIWAYSDGSCMVSAAARGAEWRIHHAGLWGRILIIEFKMYTVGNTSVTEETVGHAVFVFEDGEGYTWVYSNGGSRLLGKHLAHDARTLATYIYGVRVVSAEFED